MRTVIVPLDGSALAERALGPATALARVTGAEIELLQVVVDRAAATDAHVALEAVVDRLRADEPAGIVVRPPIVLEADWPAECIANAAEQPDSLVCLSTHGSTGVRRALLGSVAEDVARLAPGPVLLVGPEVPLADGWAPTGDLLVCVDGSDASEAILPAAAALGAQTAMAPRVLTVAPSDAPVAPEEETGYVREVAAGLDRTLGRPAGTTPFEVLHDQPPGEALVAAARAVPAAAIAMATHGKTGLARVAAGSVTTWVVRHAPCPVLVLRPEPALLRADEPPSD